MSYSRTNRLRHQGKHLNHPEGRRPSLRQLRVKLPWFLLLGLSALMSLLSVANPLLISFADSLQTQALYTGQAFLAGRVPYMDFYSSGGLVYHFLLLLGSILGNPLALMLVQFVLVLVAGVAFYKCLFRLTGLDVLSRQMLLVFYLCLGILAWGGLYAPLFALPFVLYGLLFLLEYFAGEARDEGFVLYGINGALVFLIDPKSSLLWLIAGLVLVGYNIKQERKARGVYQFLGTVFGFSLILYTVGYYTILYQNVGAAIEQTVLVPLQSLGHWQEEPMFFFFLLAVYLLGTGLLTSLVYGGFSLIRPENRASKVLLYLTMLVAVALVLLTPHFSPSHLLLVLPYGLALTASYIAERSIVSQPNDLEGEETAEEWLGNAEPVTSYWALNAFLPILASLYLIAYPAWLWFDQGAVQAERATVASKIAEETTKTDLIYAWDNSASIYLMSQRFASAEIITPDTYKVTEDQQKALALALGYDRAKIVVVNQDLDLPETVAHHLEENYQEMSLEAKQFKVYQLK
ncbi:hypothetical protein [Streptococcus ovuberis]|uniref:Heme/copper-type cytochrome/quinol oxidase, subunit 1 n=1 Tax=Streptococcus ovuberis TaxID=1936207 RepID=A0A7X6S0Y5_9STRE|nr:hypothetical protein [Streptococcus ovuberis]NKZ19606.1 hypothetical protein [Streptococcus ovuberis]